MKKKKGNTTLGKNILLLIMVILIFLVYSEIFFRIITEKPPVSEQPLWEYVAFWESKMKVRLGPPDLEKKDDSFRIAVLGDSFTLGDGTEDNKSLEWSAYPRTIENLLNNNFDDYNYEVLNFGVVGSNSLDHRYILEGIVFNYTPDLIIFSVSGNDWYVQSYNLDPFRYCDIKTSFSEKSLYLLNRHFELFRYLYTRLYGIDYFVRKVSPKNTIGKKCFNRSIARIKDSISDKDIPHFIVYIYDLYALDSDPNQVFKNFNAENDTTYKIGFFSSVFEKNDFQYVSAYPYFMNLTHKEVFSDDNYHFNAYSNALIAGIAYNHMLENRLIPSCENENIDCSSKLVSIR